MQAKSSINFKPIKPNAENHNKRLGNQSNLSYVRPELTHLNEIWERRSVRETLKELASIVKEKTGRKMQAKAVPVREAVVNIKSDTTLDDLKQLANELEGKFGIKVFQIATHKDEGHHKRTHIKSRLKDGQLNPEWKPNLHAHIVCEWIDRRTGKRLDLNEEHMSEIQTLTAHVLQMQRGEHGSKRQRLEAKEFKLQAQEQQFVEQLQEMSELNEEKAEALEIIKQSEEAKQIVATLAEKYVNTFEIAKHIEDAAKSIDVPKEIVDADGKAHKLNDWDRLKADFGAEIKIEGGCWDTINSDSPSRNIIKRLAGTVWIMWNKRIKKWFNPTTKPSLTEAETNRNIQKVVKTVEKRKGMKIGR